MKREIKTLRIIIAVLMLLNIIMSLMGYKLQIRVIELEKENESLINLEKSKEENKSGN